jgi:HEAT repeat protein
MELLNRVLVFAAYVLVGCVIGIGAWAGGIFYANSNSPGEHSDNVHQGSELAVDGGDTGGPSPGVHIEHLFAQRAQIERLQAALAQKDALLDRKTQLLDQKTEEQLTLQSELESAIGMLEMLAAEVFARRNEPGEDDEDRLSADLERLRDERNKNLALAERLRADLDELKAELTVTDERIQQLQDQSELETTVLLAEMRTFQTVATQALAGLGGESVTALVDLLSDPRPRVRRWAASVLGQIGPPARDAIPALVDAMADEDPAVQQEVRRALEIIQPLER